jgi:hypothetical protein
MQLPLIGHNTSPAEAGRRAAEALEKILPSLSAKDRDFAESLLRGYGSYGFTPKQLYWAQRLSGLITEPKEERAKAAVGDLSSVLALFDKAGQKLKKPAIVLTLNGNEIRISVASQRARHPGTLDVVNESTGTWHGRILRDGNFEISPRDEPIAGLLELLKAFAANPAKVAAAHGFLTGRCCFCNLKLTDERSTAAGYDAKCASNYGLDYPSLAEARAMTMKEAA